MISREIRITTLIIVALSILVLSLIPQNPLSVNSFRGIDKLEHYTAYLVLAFLLYLNIYEVKTSKLFTLIITITLAILYGSIIEFLQKFTGRSPELFDIMADFLGSVSGATFALFMLKRIA